MRDLGEILAEYQDLRDSYRNFINKGDGNKGALLEFERKFVDLKADLSPWKSKLTGDYGRTDDKAATARKYRIAFEMSRGEFIDSDGAKFDKCTLSVAEKLSPATLKYQAFIEERAFNKESLNSVSDTREDINSFINLLKDQIR